jgi:hypothetical protein
MPDPTRDEDEQERLNRQMIELLNELRVVIPGVQVLFAFLLTVPFQNRFSEATDLQHYVYLGTLLASAAATGFLVAPTGFHRILFQQGDKPLLIRNGTRMLLAGLISLWLAMSGATFLVVDFVFARGTSLAIALVVFVLLGGLWFGVGLTRRLNES